MILLTSDGLSSDKLVKVVKDEVDLRSFKSAVIITTADHEYKGHNWNVNRLTDELNACGLMVDLFDFDEDDVKKLDNYEVILINGGNPFYLLDRLNKYLPTNYFQDFVANNKILIGYSAGSVVLQKNIVLLSKYAVMTNFINLEDLRGLNLVDVEILPHYAKFSNIFNNFKEICIEYEQANSLNVIKLNDGMGVLYNYTDKSYQIIK